LIQYLLNLHLILPFQIYLFFFCYFINKINYRKNIFNIYLLKILKEKEIKFFFFCCKIDYLLIFKEEEKKKKNGLYEKFF